jgi:hypothetical protein
MAEEDLIDPGGSAVDEPSELQDGARDGGQSRAEAAPPAAAVLAFWTCSETGRDFGDLDGVLSGLGIEQVGSLGVRIRLTDGHRMTAWQRLARADAQSNQSSFA